MIAIVGLMSSHFRFVFSLSLRHVLMYIPFYFHKVYYYTDTVVLKFMTGRYQVMYKDKIQCVVQ
jgi:hypothetical protein